ncbi:MAG: hypothetical protein A07HR60_02434 [uncultured archaeon A07HR60]|nr:MAG: hypothetical protein A07HR60_02434 [uncultured archaeon A07HR60]
MTQDDQYSIENVDLTDGYYEIEQSLIRNKYTLTDERGNVVLRGKQEMFNLKEEFPFVNGSGEEAFTVKTDSVLDVAGSYTLLDSVVGEEVVVLDEDLSFLVETWTIRDPQTGDAIATVQSKSKLVSVLRHVSNIANIVPNTYEIFNPSDEKIGEIAGQLSLKDTYEVTIDESSTVPKEAVMASACVLDALENNN